MAYYDWQRISERRWLGGQRALLHLEKKNDLPGISSLEFNTQTWREWNWSRRGEEWTPTPEWKESLINNVLLPQIPEDRTVLEIGPGGGRWTETLQHISRDLILVDLSEICIEECRRRFADCTNITYHVGSGRDLRFQADESVEAIWSFDVFVHIAPRETAAYVAEVARVLRPGGRGIIHHPRAAGLQGGFRSRMTSEHFADLLLQHGLSVESQLTTWGDHGQWDVKYYDDAITIFEKPGPGSRD